MSGYIHKITPDGIVDTITVRKGTHLNYEKHITPYKDFLCPRNEQTKKYGKSIAFEVLPNTEGVFKSDTVFCWWDDYGKFVDEAVGNKPNPLITAMLQKKMREQRQPLPPEIAEMTLADFAKKIKRERNVNWSFLGFKGMLENITVQEYEEKQINDKILGNVLVFDNFRVRESDGQEIAA